MSEIAPGFDQQFCDSSGLPLVGGKIFTYIAGTTTPLTTYTDQTGVTPNTNPVILDSAGRAAIWIGNSFYKFVLEDSLGNIIKTVDNIQSIATQIAAISSTVQSVTMSYTQFQTAAMSNAVLAFTIPAKAVLNFVTIKHSTLFTGSAISTVIAQVGPSGAYTNIISGFDIKQAVGTGVFENADPGFIGDFSSSTGIYLNMVSTGANLSALTQGSVTIYYDYKTLP